MIVYKAVGGEQEGLHESDIFNGRVAAVGAVYVTATSLEATAWGILLGKERVVTMEVATIRDSKTLLPISKWPDAGMGLDGIGMREAVVLPSDIITA